MRAPREYAHGCCHGSPIYDRPGIIGLRDTRANVCAPDAAGRVSICQSPALCVLERSSFSRDQACGRRAGCCADPASNSDMTLGASIATAAVLTVVLIPYRDYAFNFEWAKVTSAAVYVIFTALGCAAGWGGFEAATAIGWHPAPDSTVLTGLVYGAFGQAVVRVHLDKIPGGEAAEALTPLSVAGDWLSGVFDVQVPRAVRRRLRSLSSEELAQYVGHLFRLRVVADTCLSEQAHKEFAQRVNESVRDVLSADPASRIEARSSLMAMGEGWVLKYKFDRPQRA